MTNEQKKFIDAISTYAVFNMNESGILASLTIAQSILESNWGNSALATKGKALFGIKATETWTGKVYNSDTQECYDGVNMQTVNANFRAYNSWEESIKNHTQLLTGAVRYKNIIGEKDYIIACNNIHKDGYATDPQYANKLIKIIETYDLNEYDNIKEMTVAEAKIIVQEKCGFSNETIIYMAESYRFGTELITRLAKLLK